MKIIEVFGIAMLLLGLYTTKTNLRIGSRIMILSSISFIIVFASIGMWTQVLLNLFIGSINYRNSSAMV